MKKKYLFGLLILSLVLLVGCNGGVVDSNQKKENADMYNNFRIIDKNILLDDEGQASFIQVIVETDVECEIEYDNHIISSSNDINDGQIIFMEQISNKGNLNLWSVCCGDKCKFEVEE